MFNLFAFSLITAKSSKSGVLFRSFAQYVDHPVDDTLRLLVLIYFPSVLGKYPSF